jgi:hypothetical protein
MTALGWLPSWSESDDTLSEKFGRKGGRLNGWKISDGSDIRWKREVDV